MRRPTVPSLLLSLACLLAAAPAAAISFLQQAANTSAASTTLGVTLPASPQPGSALVLAVANFGGQGVSSVSGGGVTWTRAKNSCDHVCTEVWYGLNSSGSGTAITITFSGAVDAGANVSEFAGVRAASALDGVVSTFGASTTAGTGTVATLDADDLLIGAAGINGSAITGGPTNGFSALTAADTAGGHALLEAAFQVVKDTGSYSTGWTKANANGWDGIVLALKGRGFYGPGVNAVSLTNAVVGGPNNLQIDYRFTAQETGTITQLRQYFISVAGGYGTHDATVRIQVETDSGPPDHLPAAEIGRLNSYDVLFCSGSCDSHVAFPLLTLNTPAPVTAGKIYHLVYTNTDPSPTVNYFSLDDLRMAHGLTPAQPTFTKFELGLLYKSPSGSWTEINPPTSSDSATPIVDITYADGFDQGVGYMDDYVTLPQLIGGSQEVRETFTPSDDRAVTSVSVLVARTNAGTDPLIVSLEDATGTVIEQGSIPASQFPANTTCHPAEMCPGPNCMPAVCLQGTWGTYTFTTPRTLAAGSTYRLVLSSAAATVYGTFPLENGVDARNPTDYGFGPGSAFTESGLAEYITSSTWQSWPAGSDVDLQFYFTLE